MQEKLKLGIIYGSTRVGRFCDNIVDWAISEVEKREQFLFDRIDPLDFEFPARFGQANESVQRLRSALGEADAFLVVTPEYNHSYTAPLKQLIDLAKDEWKAKPVAFISYGGVSGGLRAVEHLRAVFAELHSTTMRDVVSFANYWGKFDQSGQLLEPESTAKSLHFMLDHLEWWGVALKRAREERSYLDIAA